MSENEEIIIPEPVEQETSSEPDDLVPLDKNALLKLHGLADDDPTPAEEDPEPVTTEPSPEGEPVENDPDDPAPFEDRFKELTKDLEPVEEQPAPVQETPEQQIKKYELAIKQEEVQLSDENAWNYVVKGLPDYRFEGQSIYSMDPQTFNDYLQELQDDGNQLEYSQVVNARNKAAERAQEITDRRRQLSQAKTNIEQVHRTQRYEKAHVRWKNTVPEAEPYFQEMGTWIQNKASADPVFAALDSTDKGVDQMILQAWTALGIDAKIRKSAPKPDTETPSAPETKAASKKVKSEPKKTPTFTRKQIDKMSQKEFNANEAAINEALASGLVK